MKAYLVADIEGCCGFTIPEEGEVGTTWYPYFAKQMALEAASACKGAHSAGMESILVHDAHGTARNMDPYLLPDYAQLMRRSGPDPYAMVSGLQNDRFDALLMTGFHSWVGSSGSPSSHTFNHLTTAMTLNDMPLSEFLFDCYSAASLGVPTPFLSGDESICSFAESNVPGITTVKTLTGTGSGSISRNPRVVLQEIESHSRFALEDGHFRLCLPKLPRRFCFRVSFFDPARAAFNSCYPGIRQINDCTLEFESDNWYDVLVMVHFVLDK